MELPPTYMSQIVERLARLQRGLGDGSGTSDEMWHLIEIVSDMAAHLAYAERNRDTPA